MQPDYSEMCVVVSGVARHGLGGKPPQNVAQSPMKQARQESRCQLIPVSKNFDPFCIQNL